MQYKNYSRNLSKVEKTMDEEIDSALYQLSLAGSALLLIAGVVILLFADIAGKF